MRVSITSPRVRPSPNDRRVGIRIRTFEACPGFTSVTAHRIAQRPKAAFVAGLRPSQLPGRAACQLPDQSTIIRVRPSLTGSSRPRGARSFTSFRARDMNFRFTPPTRSQLRSQLLTSRARRRHQLICGYFGRANELRDLASVLDEGLRHRGERPVLRVTIPTASGRPGKFRELRVDCSSGPSVNASYAGGTLVVAP